MGQRPRITDEQRKQVLQYREEGFCFEDIAELVGCGRETARRICHGKDYPDYQRQSRRKKKRIELDETLGKFKPEQIIDYLRHLGYKGELTLTTKQTIKL